MGLVGLFASAPALAQTAGEGSRPAMAGEKSAIKPAGERTLGKRERPTIKKKSEQKARDEKSGRISLQIPEALRAALEKRIDRRIAYNIVQTKKLRVEAMRLLDKFIAETPETSAEMPEALMRMGELEWEDSRDRFLHAFNRWEATPADQRGNPPNPDYGKPRGRFLRVLKQHKSFRNYDLALYVDGFLANEEGKFGEALGRFNKILEWFPRSRFVPDAHMVRAEYEFTKDFPNYETAYREYEQVLKYKDSPLYDLALFKSAWTLWRLGKPEEAAKRFLIVFKKTAETGEKSAARRSELDELQSEALKNLVAVFVEDEKNRAEDMHRFLVQAGGDKFAGRIVRALADAFYEQAQYERGIEAYRLLLKLEPTAPDAYKHALAVAQGHSTMESWKKLEDDYKWIAREYLRPPPPAPGKQPQQGGAWTRVQSSETLAKAEQATEKQLRDDAVGLHAKAQADKSSLGEYKAAAGLYAVYLSRFGSRPEAYEIYYNNAEINFYHLQNATVAADSYLAAVRMNPKGPLSRDALYNALAALEAARAKEFEAAKTAGKKAEETATDKQLTQAMELYVATYPNDSKVPELLFRQGKLYYDYQVYDPAVRQWGLLIEKYPNSQYAVGAGELILDSFNKSKDYDNIETWARRLKTAPAFQGAEQQGRLNGLIVQAVFKQGEQLAAKGNHEKAAAAYLRATKEFPKEPRAAQAAVNAEIEAKRAGDMATLEAAVGVLIAEHQSRPEAPQGVWVAATTYQQVGLFSEAATYHDVIVDKWPRYEHHKDAAFNAVLLRATIGEHAKAIESGNKYKRYYPRDEGADEVTFLMGKAHEKAEKWRDASALYDRYAQSARNPSSQIEALVRLATVRLKTGDERGAESALNRALKVYREHKGLDDRGKYFAAKARYMQGERLLAEFAKVKVEGDVKQLKDRLKKKGELLKRAAETFLSTAEIGVAEWTTASLYQIGFTYESFAKALLNSPPPATLNAQEKELYSQSIEEFVIPIEEKGLEAYESGWKKAVELGIFNSWTAKMREALGRLNSELYPPLKEIGFSLRTKGPSTMPPLIDGTRRAGDGRAQGYLIPPEPLKNKESDDAAQKPVKSEDDAKPKADKEKAAEDEKLAASKQEETEEKAAEEGEDAKDKKGKKKKKKGRGK